MLLSSLFPISALALGSVAAAGTSQRASLIVFGDSLSDNGHMPHYSNYSKYWGGRYSNSYMWNEYSAKLLDLNLENYAIGGFHDRQQLIPSVTEIVHQYLANNTNVSDYKKKNSIIAIDGGGNDLFYSLDNLSTGKMSITYFIDTLHQDLLLDDGYRKIYLLNLPSLTMAPALAEALAGMLTPVLNAVFRTKLTALRLKNPSKAAENLMDTSNSPMVLRAINVTDTKNPCVVDHADGSQTYCTDDDIRYYYDSFHPSGRPHYLIGVAFANIVKNPSYPVTKWSLTDIAKQYDIAHSDKNHNILASSA
ncbi:hypothetical protein DL89DRAFT_270560 [Linderina pennispora]|uniref:SGNH hydrolase n=1 Tax=Linderina pennispora TaxID=61395 RepID=A0A1Y1VX01_9FUNG|nr:uncharacterized protein DL89DRAFT_270560 [Linderina pennispora]ORX65837.1 hypothetical protein DL89DRAFT_270560 [Linderina pennispora]